MVRNTRRPRALILSYTPFARSPRPLKQLRQLQRDYDVTTAGFGPAPLPDIPHVELVVEAAHNGTLRARFRYFLLLVLRRYRSLPCANLRDRATRRALAGGEWDVVIAHDVQTVPVANRLPGTRGVLVDLHEYAPRQNEHSLLWRLLIAPYFRWLVRHEVSRAEIVTTVSQGIVEEYRRVFDLETRLVVNATPLQDLVPQSVSRPIRLVHSGIPASARKLEIMIEAVRDTTSEVELDLYLIDDGSQYLAKLKELAASSDRIRFRDPVPYAELVRTLNGYDVGLSIIAPTTFNLEWCLPNKFFDFIQARLGVIVGPSAEMARFVEDYEIGAVAEDFTAESLRAVLENLTVEQVTEWKAKSAEHARELSSEEQVKVWGDAVAEIVAA